MVGNASVERPTRVVNKALVINLTTGPGGYSNTQTVLAPTATAALSALAPGTSYSLTLTPYLDAVRSENTGGNLRWYPGSPRIARRFLREQDRAELVELNRDDFDVLQRCFAGDRQVHVHLMDGYQALKAYLPPRERRGLVLIDSSFDRAREFDRLVDALKSAHERWATGVFALWYPLMDPSTINGFERRIVASGIRKVLKLELSVLPEGWSDSLRGSGMLVVNPPYGLEPEARAILPWLWRAMAEEGTGRSRVEWLVPE